MDPATQKAVRAIQSRRLALSTEIVARHARLQPAVVQLSSEKSIRDAGYHLDYLAEALGAADQNLFLDYVTWVKALFEGLNFPLDTLSATLRCTSQVLQETLPPELFQQASPYLDAGIQVASQEALPPPTFLGPEQPQAALCQEYLAALLRLDHTSANRRIQAALDQGLTIHQVYLHVFQPVLGEVGRLWQTSQISVAMEHYCTAATQSMMSRLYPLIFNTPRIGRRLVAACVGDELHEIGIRMVCDFFELEGWDTVYLGANTPAPGILRLLSGPRVDVLAISTTLTPHVGQVADLIARVRSSGSPVKILVGGYPFNVSPSLWQTVGADGFARDAQQAIAAAHALLEG